MKEIELYSTCNRDLDEHNAKALIIMWNIAIEEAAKECEWWDKGSSPKSDIAPEIRKLKK